MMRKLQGAGLAAAGLLLLTACGSGGGDGAYGAGTPTGAAPPSDPATPAASAPGSAAPAGDGTRLAVADDATLGKIVVDGKGWTLYRFDGDTAKPPASHCAAACAKLWPPVPWTGKVQATGFGAAAFGKVKRADGTWQLTLGGWPLYRYAKDASPGDTTGQGVGGKWFATTPAGKKAESASGGSTTGYGY